MEDLVMDRNVLGSCYEKLGFLYNLAKDKCEKYVIPGTSKLTNNILKSCYKILVVLYNLAKDKCEKDVIPGAIKLTRGLLKGCDKILSSYGLDEVHNSDYQHVAAFEEATKQFPHETAAIFRQRGARVGQQRSRFHQENPLRINDLILKINIGRCTNNNQIISKTMQYNPGNTTESELQRQQENATTVFTLDDTSQELPAEVAEESRTSYPYEATSTMLTTSGSSCIEGHEGEVASIDINSRSGSASCGRRSSVVPSALGVPSVQEERLAQAASALDEAVVHRVDSGAPTQSTIESLEMSPPGAISHNNT